MRDEEGVTLTFTGLISCDLALPLFATLSSLVPPILAAHGASQSDLRALEFGKNTGARLLPAALALFCFFSFDGGEANLLACDLLLLS